MRAGIYVRVSTAGQEDGASLATQEASCREAAAALGAQVAGIYSDVHTGAELFERPRLADLRAAIARREVDVVIVHALDRLSRKPAHQLIIADECARHGVALHSATEKIDDTPTGQLIQYVTTWAAELEREKIRERTLRGKRARLLEGKLPAATHLYGYRRDGDVRVVHEPEAMVVRDMFAWVAGEHLSIRGVTRRLNEREIPAPRSRVWGKSQVQRLLANPAYKGVTVAWRWKSRGGNRNSVIRPESEWIMLPDHVTPAIISDALWTTVQLIIAENRGDATRNAARQFLLRGMIWCERCGRRMYSDTEKHLTRVYRCSSRDKGGSCGVPRVPAADVEHEIWGELERMILAPDLIREVTSSRRDPAGGEDLERDLAGARRQVEREDRAIDRLLDRYRLSDDSEGLLWEAVQRQVAEAERSKRVIRDRIARLEHELLAREEAWRRRTSLEEYAAHVRARLDEGLSFDAKRQALLAFGARVEASGRTWRLSLTLPE